jgi:hypothetical protein
VAVLRVPPRIEALVDRVLELDGAPPPLGVALRQLVEPARAHAHVGDLVGQDVVHRALEIGSPIFLAMWMSWLNTSQASPSSRG